MMSNNLSPSSVQLIPSSSVINKNKLMKLADGIKTRKKKSSSVITSSSSSSSNKKLSSNKSSSSSLSGSKAKYDPAYTNIEHLVFGTYKSRPSTPNNLLNNNNQQNRGDKTQTHIPADNGTDTSTITRQIGTSKERVSDDGVTKDHLCSSSPSSSPTKCECKAHSPNGGSLLSNDSPKKVIHTQMNNLSPDNVDESDNCKSSSDTSELLSSDYVKDDDIMERTLTSEDMNFDMDSTLKAEDIMALQNQPVMGMKRRTNLTSKIPQPIIKTNLNVSKQMRNQSTHAIIVSASGTKDSPMKIRNELLLNRSHSYNGLDDHKHGNNDNKTVNDDKPFCDDNGDGDSIEKFKDKNNILRQQKHSSQIPKPNSGANPHQTDLNYTETVYTPIKPVNQRINHSKHRKQSSPSALYSPSARQSSDTTIPIIPNFPMMQRHSRVNRSSGISSPFDAKFAKVRSTLHANKRLLQTSALRRHHSLDPTQRYVGSPLMRSNRLRPLYNNGLSKSDEKSTNSIRFERSYSSTASSSFVKSNFSSFSSSSSESRHVSSSYRYVNSGETHSHSSQMDKSMFNDTYSNGIGKSYEQKTKRESISSKSQSNLQRNRPQLKGSPIRSKPNKSRSQSLMEKFNEMADESRAYNKTYEQIIASKLASLNFGHMLIMDEDSLMVTPEKIWKTPIIRANSAAAASSSSSSSSSNRIIDNHYDMNNRHRDLQDEGTSLHYRQYNNGCDVNNLPLSTLSSPEKSINTIKSLIKDNADSDSEVFTSSSSRTRSSEFQLSNLLLCEAQKDAINEVNSNQSSRKSSSAFSKSSRPWSHIYSESEAKRILAKTKSIGGVIGSLTNLVSGRKQDSDPDLQCTSGDDVESMIIKSQINNNPLIPHSVPSQDSVLQRFKKTFSLRFNNNNNRSGNSHRSDSPVQAKLRSSLRSKSEENRDNRSTWYEDDDGDNQSNDSNLMRASRTEESISSLLTNNDKNRRLSDTECKDIKQHLGRVPSVERQFSTPHPIKSRDHSHPRPLRRRSQTRARLRRSMSQPQDIEKWSPLQRASSRESCSHGSMSETDSECESPVKPNSLFNQSSDQQEYDDDMIFVEALWDHVTLDQEELSFRAGEVIEVTDSSDKDWWWGTISGGCEQRSGWFPATFVRMRVNQDDTVEECMSKIADGTLSRTPKKRVSVSLLSNEQVRANVVMEIINTERDFVKHLNDVIEGYLKKCKSRGDMFSDDRIKTIFGNIEQLYDFQREFLNQLESCINWEHISLSKIGDCFLHNERGFSVYCEYCNNHPLAVSELQDLYAEPKYAHFFEGCRLIQNMIDISLDGFLLTPIQKICKYPLQLGELLKYTRIDHDDYTPVRNALDAMQRVAQLVNERKRRIESLEQIVSIQQTIESWDGPPLIDTCSILILSGDVTKLSPSSWSREVTLFLFDHLLISCKRETGLLKRSAHVFKGRIDLDSVTMIVDVEDGTKDPQFNNVIAKNAFKLYSESCDKWYMFQTKTSKEKELWLQALKDERQRVADDYNQGFTVTENDKRCAQMTHMNHLKPKRPRAKLPKGSKPRRPDTAIVEISLEPPMGFDRDRSRAGSLPSHFNPANSVIGTAKGSTASGRTPVIKKKGSGWFNLGSKGKGKVKGRSMKRVTKQ